MKSAGFVPAVALAVAGVVVTVLVLFMPASGTGTPPRVRHTTRPTPSATVAPTKVLTVVEENHSTSQATSSMPYLMSLAATYAYATHWKAVTHPSLPNYLALFGGDTFGVTSDLEAVPSPLVGRAASVFGQARASGHTARVYAESMPGNCTLTSSGRYAVRHNPWAYFANEGSGCREADVPEETTFPADVTLDHLPNAGLLIPNLCHDAHDCSLATADAWLKARLPAVLGSTDFKSGRLTVVVTFDEDDNTATNSVLTVVMNAGMTKHGRVTAPLSHYSLTGYYDLVLGTPLLRNATGGMAAAFGLG